MNTDDELKIPPISSSYWESFCSPLCEFILENDRGWVHLVAWAQARDINLMVIRNALAWLEDKKYAETTLPEGVESDEGAWIWSVVDKSRAKSYTRINK